MDDRYVTLMEEFIDRSLPKPKKDEDAYIFHLHSCYRWAAYEILERLIRESMKLPTHVSGVPTMTATEVVEDFIDEMRYFSAIAPTQQGYDVFDIAAQEGESVLLYFQACESRGEL